MPETTIDAFLEERRSQPQQLVEALQDVQERFGYISEDSMKTVSETLGVSLMDVYSVASFYKAFAMEPRGKNVITICTGTACHVRGASMLLNQSTAQLEIEPGQISKDGLFTIEHVNCVGACALAPVVIENENHHHHMSPGKLRKLVKSIQETGTGEPSHE